jgi:hypothetical protein
MISRRILFWHSLKGIIFFVYFNYACQEKDVGTSMVARGAKVLPSLPRFRIVVIAFNLNFVLQRKDVGTSMMVSQTTLLSAPKYS